MTRRGRLPTAVLAVLAAIAAAIVAAPGAARGDRAVARQRVERAAARLAAGDRPGALEEIEGALAEDKDYLPAYDFAIDLWVADGDWRVLIARLSGLTLRQPRYVAGWYTLGLAYRKVRRFDLAAMCYRAYIDLRPFDPDARYGLAMASLEAADHPVAVAALRRYLELERRPERAAFVEQARAELAALGGADPSTGANPPGVVALQRIGHQLALVGAAAWRRARP